MVRDNAGAKSLLQRSRWEMLPFASFDEQLTHVPAGETITLTASPEKGVETTVDMAVETANAGRNPVVPHIAARAVTDRDQLSAIADRLQDAGISDIFVPGGDNEEPAGEFSSSYELLVALDEMGISFDGIGITGYPEGHPKIDDEALISALHKKEPYATYAVTQLCYDADTIIDWIEETRELGVGLPFYIGVPGVMNYQKLAGISAKVGVGESIRFVRKTTGIIGMIKRMIGSRGVYKPDSLLDGLAPYADNEVYDITGLHLYTFNRAQDTADWRASRLR